LEPRRKLFGIGIGIGVAIGIGIRCREKPVSLRIKIIPDRDIETEPDSDPEGSIISPRYAGQAEATPSRRARFALTKCFYG